MDRAKIIDDLEIRKPVNSIKKVQSKDKENIDDDDDEDNDDNVRFQ